MIPLGPLQAEEKKKRFPGPLGPGVENRKKKSKRSQPVKSKRGREEGDGTENVINCRELSQIVVTIYDEFYDDL